MTTIISKIQVLKSTIAFHANKAGMSYSKRSMIVLLKIVFVGKLNE